MITAPFGEAVCGLGNDYHAIVLYCLVGFHTLGQALLVLCKIHLTLFDVI
jgi:hypothetical protein